MLTSLNITSPFEEWQNWDMDKKATDFMQEIEKRRVGYNTGHFLMPLGCDFSWQDTRNETWARVEPVVDYINTKYGNKYKVHYSLLSDYMNTVLGPTKNLSKFSQYDGPDFMPYSDSDDGVWSGYYSSYPLLKHDARAAEPILRSANILYSISPGNGTLFLQDLEQLRQIVGDVTHHDGITGTSKRHVVNDYYLPLLRRYTSACQLRIAEALQRISKKEWKLGFVPVQITSQNSTTPVIAFNNLGWKRNAVVMVDVETQNNTICVTNAKGEEQQSQVLVESTGKEQLTFIGTIPALGIETYVIKHGCATGSKREKPQIMNKAFTINNDKLQISFCDSNGVLKMCRMKRIDDDLDVEMNHEYMAYTGATYGSGAYVFRPADETPTSVIHEAFNTMLYNGTVCKRVEQIVTNYIRHVYTLCEGRDYLYQEITIGGPNLPAGKEIVSRFGGDEIKNQRTIYCDKYGLETRKMEKPTRTEETQTIAASFLPMTSLCYIRSIVENGKTVQLSVQSAQAQGAASIKEGTVELMLYRMTETDDGKGVGEKLDDTSIYTSRLRLRIDKVTDTFDPASVMFARDSLEFNNPPVVVMGETSATNLGNIPSYAAIDQDMPNSIHLLSLDTVLNRNLSNVPYPQRVDTKKTILRIQNIGEKDETVDVSKLVTLIGAPIRNEATLSASKAVSSAVIDPQSVTLRKNEIRTFSLQTPIATAELKAVSSNNTISGRINFELKDGGVNINARIWGLLPGSTHAIAFIPSSDLTILNGIVTPITTATANQRGILDTSVKGFTSQSISSMVGKTIVVYKGTEIDTSHALAVGLLNFVDVNPGVADVIAPVEWASCLLQGIAGHPVSGTIYFRHNMYDSTKVYITGSVSGLRPNGVHAWHIHEFGHIGTSDGGGTGVHYDPYKTGMHGIPDTSAQHHIGDFGNLNIDANGNVTINAVFNSRLASGFHSQNSIIGRGLIIHQKNDDGHQPVGNAGTRYAQCVIGLGNVPDSDIKNVANASPSENYYGTCELASISSSNSISGRIILSESDNGTRIQATICGLPLQTRHGIYVHEFGDLTGKTVDSLVGSRYNGLDLGNITADSEKLHVDRISTSFSMRSQSMLGRSIVIKQFADNEKQTDQPMAVCVIGYAKTITFDQACKTTITPTTTTTTTIAPTTTTTTTTIALTTTTTASPTTTDTPTTTNIPVRNYEPPEALRSFSIVLLIASSIVLILLAFVCVMFLISSRSAEPQ
jgi:Cu/Zn superoxide dismutase